MDVTVQGLVCLLVRTRHAALCVGFVILSALHAAAVAQGLSQAPPPGPVPVAVSEAIKANFARQFASLAPVDEVRSTPIAGLFEVRVGVDIFYSTERAEYVFQGDLVEGRTGASLTQRRIHQLTAIDPAQLSTADAVTWSRGKGERRLFVFADPHCGPCRTLEAELSKVDNITVHTFIVPVLGGDSPRRARDLWCHADRTAAWRGWMLHGRSPPPADAACQTQAIERNLNLVPRYRIAGTPTIVLANGERLGGVPSAERLERDLARTAR